MGLVLGLGGDTMLGRKVAERIARDGPHGLFGDGVLAAAAEADLLVVNLECCISERGERWPDPHKPFYFRAPPAAVDTLAELGVDTVNLANNHALDFGATALTDTLAHLDAAGIGHTGAGADLAAARESACLAHAGSSVEVIGMTDHPADFAAAEDEPGTAFADLRATALPGWVEGAVGASTADITVLTPHWGPNMVSSPVRHVRRTAAALADTGVDLVAGHSAHVFHGVGLHDRGDDAALPVLYDLGDLIDDYAVDHHLRNDLGVLWLVHVDDGGPAVAEAVPLTLGYRRTVRATGDDHVWVRNRLRRACDEFGTGVEDHDGRLRIRLR